MVFHSEIAAEIRKTNEIAPVTALSRVVWRTVKPNELIRSDVWLVSPFPISWVHAWKKNSQVLGSFNASMNLHRRSIMLFAPCCSRERRVGGWRGLLTGISWILSVRCQNDSPWFSESLVRVPRGSRTLRQQGCQGKIARLSHQK